MTWRKRALGAAALWLAAISPACALEASVALAVSAPAAPPAEVRTSPQESFDKYQVLLSNNIFVRDRARWAPKASAAPLLSPEEATALRGIVRQGEGASAAYVVFLEDVRTQQTTEMRVGERVCAGRLVNPTLESVDYLKNGVAKRIEIGQNLTGAEAVAPGPPAADQSLRAGGPGGPPGGPPGAAEGGSSPNLQVVARGVGASPDSTAPPLSPEMIAEQMREKRLKELGK
jgi:hypothetical protein